jgi:hypothetical protein
MTTLTHDDTNYPWRRLLAAVVVRAVRDAHAMEKRTPQKAQRSAHEFLADGRVQTLYADHLRIDVPPEVWRRARLKE